MLFILALGAWLRFHALAQDARLHPDEALYNTFARDAAIQGRWMLPGLLDKPPLSIYANALAMTFVGVTVNDAGVLDFPGVRVGEFAGRLPNTLASVILIAVVYALAKRLYQGETVARRRAIALGASLLMALSPFAIAFSATAFTDVFMVLWSTMALWMAACGRWTTSGLCLALGFASKQPALLYLPLILAIGLLYRIPSPNLSPLRRGGTKRSGLKAARGASLSLTLRRLSRFAGALAVGVALLLAWDSGRGQPSIWQVSAARENYPARLIDASEILPRLSTWLSYGQWLLGPGAVTGLFAALSLLAAVVSSSRRALLSQVDTLLMAYIVGFGLLYWLAAFNTFDRYLLPLAPLLAVVAARATVILACRISGTGAQRFYHTRALIVVSVVGLAVMLLAAWNASEGRINVGGDLGEHDGIDRVAGFLNSQPVATVVYDRWLGWELRYYLGSWSDKRLTYYPTPETLVKDALALREIGPRYFPVPANQDATEWLRALAQAGFAPTRVLTAGRLIVYRLIPPWSAAGDADAG